jgi:hypothetical protein
LLRSIASFTLPVAPSYRRIGRPEFSDDDLEIDFASSDSTGGSLGALRRGMGRINDASSRLPGSFAKNNDAFDGKDASLSKIIAASQSYLASIESPKAPLSVFLASSFSPEEPLLFQEAPLRS